jgi:hypothetical protein
LAKRFHPLDCYCQISKLSFTIFFFLYFLSFFSFIFSLSLSFLHFLFFRLHSFLSPSSAHSLAPASLPRAAFVSAPGRLFVFVGDSPGGPLKQLGKPHLKPAKSQAKHVLLKHAHGAWPTPRWPRRPTKAAHSKIPSSRLCLARGHTHPSSGLRPVRECTLTSSGLRLARGFTPPPSRLRLARGHPARTRPFPHAGTSI